MTLWCNTNLFIITDTTPYSMCGAVSMQQHGVHSLYTKLVQNIHIIQTYNSKTKNWQKLVLHIDGLKAQILLKSVDCGRLFQIFMTRLEKKQLLDRCCYNHRAVCDRDCEDSSPAEWWWLEHQQADVYHCTTSWSAPHSMMSRYRQLASLQPSSWMLPFTTGNSTICHITL